MSTVTAEQVKDGCLVKFCRDCKYSIPEPSSEWTLRCTHPVVNAQDPWALTGVQPHGSSARDERSRTWGILGRPPCGMRGALWAPKDKNLERKP